MRSCFLYAILIVNLTACSIVANKNYFFKKELDVYERKILKTTGVLEKDYVSYGRNRNIQLTGRLKVLYYQGKYTFIQKGTWYDYYDNGELLSVAVNDEYGNLIKQLVYERNGDLGAEIVGFKEIDRGDTLFLHRIISFFPSTRADTSSIETFIIKGNDMIKHGNFKYYNILGEVIQTIRYNYGRECEGSSHAGFK